MKGRLVYVAVFALLTVVFLDLVIFDRWQIRGQIVDAESGEPLSEVLVLASFYGEAPLVNLPIPPHPEHRSTECMGNEITRTEEHGGFRSARLTQNRRLANKSAHVVAFKPGWIAVSSDTPMRSSLLAAPPDAAMISLLRGPGQLRSATAWSRETQARLDPMEFTYTEELFATLRVVARATFICEEAGKEVLVVAMDHAISIATSFDERFRTRGRCQLTAEILRERGSSWPFDCNNLAFNHHPSREVLALEAELRSRGVQQELNLNEAPL